MNNHSSANQPQNGAVAEKRLCRQALLAERDAMPLSLRRAGDRALRAHIAALPAFRQASALLLYYPVGSEIDLLELAVLAIKQGIPVGLPVCNRQEKTITFRLYDPATPLQPGNYGIPIPPETAPQIVPDRNTLCLVPALAFDSSLHRIGYGGGYYDRFLATFPGISVGACYSAFIRKTVYAQPHDQPVQILVTESGIWHP